MWYNCHTILVSGVQQCTTRSLSIPCWALRLLCISVIVNNAAVNKEVDIFFFQVISVSLDEHPEIELLDLMVVLFLSFLRDMLFPQWLHQFTMHKGFLFSTSSPGFVIFCLFENTHSIRCEVISN